VLACLDRMKGGELFVPKIPSMNILELAKALAPECRTEVVGIRPGEKLHEVLISSEDARHTIEYADRFEVLPELHQWRRELDSPSDGGKPCAEDFSYTSDANTRWLSIAEMRQMTRWEG
jgi:UDP-N-acetylglucosamine 4,6-dehydratase